MRPNHLPYARVNLPQNEWYSPKWIFDALNITFDIDVCAPESGVPWVTAKSYFSLKDDGLSQDWGYKSVWMNPPYNKPTPWIEKFIANKNGIALIPTTTGKWFLDLWNDEESCWLAMKPIRFFNAHLQEAKMAFPSRSWLVALGETNITALKLSGLGTIR